MTTEATLGELSLRSGSTAVRRRPLARYAIELRKLVDTRSARAVLAVTLGQPVVALVLSAATQPWPTLTVPGLARDAAGLVASVLPLLAVLTVAGEWRQRTVLVSFALDPNRTAVLAAKCLALLTVVVAAAGLTVVGAWLTGRILGGQPTAAMELLVVFGWIVLALGAMALVGVGLAGMLLNVPLAMVIYLVAPQLVPQLVAQVAPVAAAAPYLDVVGLVFGLLHGSLPENLLACGSALLVWIVIPLVIGAARFARSDVS